MALQTSGQITLNDIHMEAGGSSGTQCSLNDSDIRGLISKASGAQMAFSEWYGASNTIAYTVLMVGGGGGCGRSANGRAKGGGGAGEVLYGTLNLTPGTTYTITIGAGGTVNAASAARSNNGGYTRLSGGGLDYRALGGGGGACGADGNTQNSGGTGGSGGGSTNNAGAGGTSAGTQSGGAGTLSSFKSNGGAGAGGASSADSHTGGGGAGGVASPASGENKCCFPVQFGLGGPAITRTVNGTSYNVAAGGTPITTSSWWVNRGLNGISAGQTFFNGQSTTRYGDGGSNTGAGQAGVFIIGKSGISNVVKTSSGTITINSNGTIS